MYKNESFGKKIQCFDVKPEDIRTRFETRTPAHINMFAIKVTKLNESDFILPDDILDNHTVTDTLQFYTYSTHIKYRLITSANTFNDATKLSVKTFEIRGFDVNETDLNFIKGFNNLVTFKATYIINIDLAKWDDLLLVPISYTDDEDSQSVEANAIKFSRFGKRLKILDLGSNNMNNSAMSRILQIFLNTSIDTIETITISCNQLTMIPKEITLFKSLVELFIGDQKNIREYKLPSRSLHFSHCKAVKKIFIQGICKRRSWGIAEIDPEAFGGNIFIICI